MRDVRTSLRCFGELSDCEGVELRLHATLMYNSLFRFDDELLVTPHLYARTGSRAPLLHLRRLGAGGIFDSFAGHFEDVWAASKSAQVAAA